MTDPTQDPLRRCLPVEAWPIRDRTAWEAALRSGDILDVKGPAAHWRLDTRKKVAASYGRFLTFHARRGQLDPGQTPADRLSEEVLKAYILELAEQVAPVTLAQRITELHEALRVMAPEHEFRYLRRAYQRLAARAQPSRDKRSRLIHPRVLLDLALHLMEGAEGVGAGDVTRACRFRDGLILAVLAARAIRLGNLTSMRIGHQLQRDGPGYLLTFSGEETKNHRPLTRPLPAVLTAYIDQYLTVHRPLLLSGNESDRLWISYAGRPLGSGSIYGAICRITEREFGHAINPHLIRDCHATFIALDDPEHVGVIPLDLGHNDHATGERHYNQADTVSAARQYQKGIQSLRQQVFAASRQPRNPAGRA